MGCLVTTTASVWPLQWKPWESACCSTSANRLFVTDNVFSWPALTDPHFYRADDIEKAASQIPSDAFAILLAHTPEVYDRAMSARFDLMLCGHTHGGQLCLPGGIPIKLDAALPRFMGAGPWRHGRIYTSVSAGTSLLPVRLNCPPEITLHTLRDGQQL